MRFDVAPRFARALAELISSGFDEKGMISIGALHHCWVEMLQREMEPQSVGEYGVHLGPTTTAEVEQGEVLVPEGMYLDKVHEEDIDEVCVARIGP